jgi:transposase InsO family protein
VAKRNRKSEPGMIFHSDRGVQYASEEFRNTLDKNVVQSMSRKGNCWDNAVAESFFKSLKCELIYGNRLLSPEQLELEQLNEATVRAVLARAMTRKEVEGEAKFLSTSKSGTTRPGDTRLSKI